jgi:hypothetical protein
MLESWSPQPSSARVLVTPQIENGSIKQAHTIFFILPFLVRTVVDWIILDPGNRYHLSRLLIFLEKC